MLCNEELVVVVLLERSMTRIRIGEPPLLRISPSGPSGTADLPLGGPCSSPRVTPEAHPSQPRTDPPISLGRQVLGFSDDTSQIGEGGWLSGATVAPWLWKIPKHLKTCEPSEHPHGEGNLF